MSKKTKNNISKEIEDFVQSKILQEDIQDVFGQRFARYAKYIIQDRALPDVRDGLKPVQRRILYSLYSLGIFSNKSYKKCARIVGDVIGKYRPHGDSSVYEAMVRLSQDFKMRLPLIDIHGNNGSIDGDPAAAMRYTEARMSKYAEFLLQDINKRTVGFIPNFDDEELEPVVLPAKFPNILVNGSSGISAGYATDIPPHNIDEIINATIYRIEHPNSSLKDLMKFVKGPDFPTGGIVQGINGLKQAYKTGRGKIIIRAKSEIETNKNMHQIIFYEIPYEVNKAVLVKKMNDVYVRKNIDGILEIRDETDRTGLRIVVDVKKEINPADIRDFFFKTTDLQVNYSFNVTLIHDKRPKLMGLIDILDAYIGHQKEVITNRSNYELETASKRLHIVEGLIAMTSILDSVIHTIRNSKNKKDAKENLVINYTFTELQAEAIVMLQLYRLTNTDIVALEDEQKKLSASINDLNTILSDESSLLKVIKKELNYTLSQLSSPRRTVIESEIEEINVTAKELIPKEDVFVILTNDGYLKRINARSYANLNKGETTKIKDNDFVIADYKVTTLDVVLFFTDLGNYIYLPVIDIPDVKHKDLGYHISTLISIEADEKIIFSVPVDDFEKERYLLFTTRNGFTKRTLIKDMIAVRYSRALRATKIRENDRLVSVDISDNKEAEVIMITKKGYMNRYDSSEISIMAPPSFGVKAMELKNRPDDEIIAGLFVEPKDIIINLMANGSIRRFKQDEILKGKKNNVGKPYIQLMRTVDNTLIDAEVVHEKNSSNNLDLYIIGETGFENINYQITKTATSPTGKKVVEKEIGIFEKLAIYRNNNDFS
ncbi:MAG TPA: DNA topoisomerase IV subunit A [Acholeplasmataceae bacterium]|nr:DNA topoisomerase IV subunit A [Acholeplasmataceae bacterium]